MALKINNMNTATLKPITKAQADRVGYVAAQRVANRHYLDGELITAGWLTGDGTVPHRTVKLSEVVQLCLKRGANLKEMLEAWREPLPISFFLLNYPGVKSPEVHNWNERDGDDYDTYLGVRNGTLAAGTVYRQSEADPWKATRAGREGVIGYGETKPAAVRDVLKRTRALRRGAK